MVAVSALDRAVVLGLDPALTSFGYSWAPDRVGTLKPGDLSGLPRLRWLRDAVGGVVRHLQAHGPLHLAVVEGMYPTGEKYVQERAALFWWTVDVVDALGVPVAIAPPQQLKMLATGKGSGAGSDKPAVVAAARDRLGYRGTDHNEADAVWLAELGYVKLGHPHVRLPEQHTRALKSVAWPR